MRSLALILASATPALAHPAAHSHSHAAEWAVPVVIAVIAATFLAARARK